MTRQRIIAALLALLLAGLALGSFLKEQNTRSKRDASMDGWEEYTVYWFDLFDTVTRVVGYAPSQEEWTKQVTALHEDLLRYHKLYDIYNTYPDLTNLAEVNAEAGAGPVRVDEEIFSMLKLAKEMYTVTGGKADVAMGTVLQLWHEAREAGINDPQNAALPDETLLKQAAGHMDINDLILDESACTVYFADPLLQLDVGSVGKGYAVEQTAKAAEARGLTSAFISVGGNLRAIGHKPDGSSWSGGIENASDPSSVLCSTTEESGMSLVTSGDYQRYYTVDGKNYCHLIDPDTLYPAEFCHAVSVLCNDSGYADCLSTGLFCMTVEEGRSLAESLEGVEACWQLNDGSMVTTSGFEYTK